MVAVGNDHGREVIVGQTGPDRVLMAGQQGGHAVAQVREALGPHGDQSLQILLIRHVVPQRDGDAVAARIAAEFLGPFLVGGDREEPDRAPGQVDQLLEITDVGFSDTLDAVGPPGAVLG